MFKVSAPLPDVPPFSTLNAVVILDLMQKFKHQFHSVVYQMTTNAIQDSIYSQHHVLVMSDDKVNGKVNEGSRESGQYILKV